MEQPSGTQNLTVELDSLVDGTTPGTLEYTANSRVMRASYDVYVFDAGAFRSTVGVFNGRTVELTVRILQSGTHVHHASSGATPHGGLKNKIHNCEVVSVTDAGTDKM